MPSFFGAGSDSEERHWMALIRQVLGLQEDLHSVALVALVTFDSCDVRGLREIHAVDGHSQ